MDAALIVAEHSHTPEKKKNKTKQNNKKPHQVVLKAHYFD